MYQLVYCHMVCLTMVHSRYTAEQRYLMVKSYLHNNNIYTKYVHTNEQSPKNVIRCYTDSLMKPALNGNGSGKPKI